MYSTITMGNKSKKFTKSHTSSIEAAEPILKVLETRPEVTKISLGRIKNGLSNVGGHRRVKITEIGEKALRLAVRGNISHQEVTIFTEEKEKTTKAIESECENMKYIVSFG